MVVLLALASSLVWGVSDFAGGVLSRRMPPYLVVGASQTLAVVPLTAAVLAMGDRPAGGPWLAWAIGAAVFGAGGLMCFYRGLAIGPMGVVAAIAALGGAVPVALGVALGEAPTPLMWAGMAAALVGASLAAGPELHAKVNARAVTLGGAAALLFGLALFAMDRAGRHSTVLTTWTMRLTTATACVVILLVARRRAGPALRQAGRAWLPLAAIGAADALANFLFMASSSQGMVSVAAVLGSLYPVVTILLARLLLHEHLRHIQHLGVALSLLGVVGIAAG